MIETCHFVNCFAAQSLEQPVLVLGLWHISASTVHQQTLIHHKCISKDCDIWHILCELTYLTGKWYCSPFPQFTGFDIDSSFAFHWTKQLTATLVVSPEWLGISKRSNVSQTLVSELASVWCSLLSHSHCNIYTHSPHNKSQHFNNRWVTSHYFTFLSS